MTAVTLALSRIPLFRARHSVPWRTRCGSTKRLWRPCTRQCREGRASRLRRLAPSIALSLRSSIRTSCRRSTSIAFWTTSLCRQFRLPVQTISALSYEIIVHSSTTGAPTPVAEGAAKPELVLNTTALTLTAIKLACHVGASYEAMQDFFGFQSYIQVEAMRQLMDLENAQLLS